MSVGALTLVCISSKTGLAFLKRVSHGDGKIRFDLGIKETHHLGVSEWDYTMAELNPGTWSGPWRWPNREGPALS